jgi:hypothetical protein
VGAALATARSAPDGLLFAGIADQDHGLLGEIVAH